MKSRISVCGKVANIINACTHSLHAATSRGQFMKAITCNKVVSIISVCDKVVNIIDLCNCCMQQRCEDNLCRQLHVCNKVASIIYLCKCMRQGDEYNFRLRLHAKRWRAQFPIMLTGGKVTSRISVYER